MILNMLGRCLTDAMEHTTIVQTRFGLWLATRSPLTPCQGSHARKANNDHRLRHELTMLDPLDPWRIVFVLMRGAMCWRLPKCQMDFCICQLDGGLLVLQLENEDIFVAPTCPRMSPSWSGPISSLYRPQWAYIHLRSIYYDIFIYISFYNIVHPVMSPVGLKRKRHILVWLTVPAPRLRSQACVHPTERDKVKRLTKGHVAGWFQGENSLFKKPPPFSILMKLDWIRSDAPTDDTPNGAFPREFSPVSRTRPTCFDTFQKWPELHMQEGTQLLSFQGRCLETYFAKKMQLAVRCS